MSEAAAFIAIIGMGDGPGVEANIGRYPARDNVRNAAGRTGKATGEMPDSVPSRLWTAIGEWASVPSNFHPSSEPDAFTVKISKHRDSRNAEWLWVGLYQTVVFGGEKRGGSYFGAGLALQEVPAPQRLYAAVEKVFSLAWQELFVGERMARSVFSLDPGSLDLPHLEGCEPLVADRGLDSTAPMGRFIELNNVLLPTVANQIRAALQSDDWTGYSTLYLANWRDPYLKNEFTVPISPASKSLVPSGVGQSQRDYDAAAAGDEAVRRYQSSQAEAVAAYNEIEAVEDYPVAGQSFEERLWHKLDRIEKQGKNIERQLLNVLEPRTADPPSDPAFEDSRYDVDRLVKIALIAGAVIFILLAVYSVAAAVYDAVKDTQMETGALDRLKGPSSQ